MKFLVLIKEFVVNLFFPPRCEFCYELINWVPAPKYPLCEKCLYQVLFIGENACKTCGKQLNEQECDYCRCNIESRYFTSVLSACEYDGCVREKLLEFKFKGRKQLYKVFSAFIMEKLKMTNEQKIDIIISVPLHFSKLRERGYNQSELIAKEIANQMKLPLYSNGLIKNKLTQNQSTLDKYGRSVNVRNAFEILNDKELKGKRILLVDDIITTGATVNECSKILKAAGAEEVVVATVATGKSNSD